uniref:Uncharacterized protein n=1 Tax=Lepeophtheirus salmonis TaxID=72036 RepID=A0A0K2VIK2_LEPSM
MAALSSNYSLHTAVESLAGVDDELFGQVVPLLYNGGLQGAHVRMRCPVSLPLQSYPHSKVQQVQIWGR